MKIFHVHYTYGELSSMTSWNTAHSEYGHCQKYGVVRGGQQNTAHSTVRSLSDGWRGEREATEHSPIPSTVTAEWVTDRLRSQCLRRGGDDREAAEQLKQ